MLSAHVSRRFVELLLYYTSEPWCYVTS